MKTFKQFLEETYLILEKQRQYDDSHGFDRTKHDELEVDYDRPRGKNDEAKERAEQGGSGYTRITHKPSGITYEIDHKNPQSKRENLPYSGNLKGKAQKAHGHKPEHSIRWDHDKSWKERGNMTRAERIRTARNAKKVWDKHIQQRIPSGHLVSNNPDINYDENRKNPDKNTRASIYKKSGFAKTNRMGVQYSTKIGNKLHPVNDDEN